jgi:hypothetical protein
MKRSVLRRVVFSLLVVAVASSLALVAGTLKHWGPRPGEQSGKAPGGGGSAFTPCPVPSCMAPCQFPAEPEVICRDDASGVTSATTWACCCCGGGGENSFHPL